MTAPKALGEFAYTCSWIAPHLPGSTIAACHGLLNINTQWHKSQPSSAAAVSFLVDTRALVTKSLGPLSPLAFVVTGTTGAWPKPDSVNDFFLDVVVSRTGA
jgi:hypothetical protein